MNSPYNMCILLLAILFNTQASKLVEYQFGLNYGTVFYDYSLNSNHGYVSSPSVITFTDRGIYFRNKNDMINIKQFVIPDHMSVLLWVLPSWSLGYIYYQYKTDSIRIYLKASYQDIGLQAESTKYLYDDKSFTNGVWGLILIRKTFNKYSLRTQINKSVELDSIGSTNLAIGGTTKHNSFKGYVWYFAVFDEIIDPDIYYSTTHVNTCLFGNCNNCKLAFIDPTYGTVCLSNEILPHKDANSKSCSDKKYGCSNSHKYDCVCTSNSCLYNIASKIPDCKDLVDTTSCIEPLVKRDEYCCPEKCESCDSSKNCLTCLDPMRIVLNGECVCIDHYFGNFTDNFNTTCQECSENCVLCLNNSYCLTCKDANATAVNGTCLCNDGYYDKEVSVDLVNCQQCMSVCGKCNGSSYCLTCTHENAEAVDGVCLCNDGYYDKEVLVDLINCQECSLGCKTCTDLLICTECLDVNAIIVDGYCVCKPGMYGTVSSVSSVSGCDLCHLDCTECINYDYCTKCSNPKTYALDGVCFCKDHYYKLPKEPLVTCSPCNEDCKTCTDSTLCTECNSKYAVPYNSQGCQCKQSYFNTTSLTKYSSCQKCENLCQTCSSLEYCTECSGNNTQMVSNKCTCLPGYYYPGSPSTDCKFCTDYRVAETCRLNCAKGTGWYKGQCEKCKDYCVECDDNLMCLECASGMQIVNGLCECFKAEVIIDGKCEPKYFNVSMSIGINNEIGLEFSEETEILLGNKDFKLYFFGDRQEVEVGGTNFKSYLIKQTKFESFLQATQVDIEINKVVYSTENSQLNDYELKGYFIATPLTPFAAAIKSTTKSVMTVTFASAMVSNPAACWILINTIQIIAYMPLTLLDYPSNILDFIQAIGDYSIIPNFMPKILNKDSSSQPIKRLQKSGIKSSVFWVNAGPNTIILLLYIALSPFIYLGSKLPYTHEKCQEMLNSFKYNLFIRFWTETYLEFGLFSLIQIESVIAK